ncbi:putative reverse transcriptase domain-containing protein [Tanacetum coccineum]|uniref:Reverse transcriptase domain-containing protein n=1 Tax=Tanacetum coccineum TaxID=301880 RepID=A0ABQ5AYM0_9ASTR
MAPKKAPALTEANINRLIQERVDEAIAIERERVRNENNLEVPPPTPTLTPATDPAANPAPGLAVVIFAAATLQDSALTWWNNQVSSMGRAIANSKSWTEIKAMMTEELCPPEEIQRMEHELWNLKVKDYNITAYTTRFNELILLCPEMVPTEKKKVEAYIRGLSDNIQGEVTSSSPTTLSRTIRMAHKLMEQKRKSKMDREAEAKKRKWESFQPEGNSGGNRNNQRNQRNNNRGDWRDNNRQYQPNHQRQGNARAMTGARNNEIDQGGPAPKCNRCRVHHFGNCPAKCNKCGKIRHKDSDCRGKGVAAGAHTQSIRACFECGDRNHFRDQCPKRNNQKEGNATGRAYAIKDF